MKAICFQILLCFLALAPQRLHAAPDHQPRPLHYTPTAGLREAFQHYFALDLAGGDQAILRELAADPQNLLAYYVADYSDFFFLLFNGNAADMATRRSRQQERINRLDGGPDSDPWKLFTKSGVNLHWAILKARFGENLKAATSLRRSYIQIKDNSTRFPSFAPNKLLYGLEEAIAGCIPEDYQWLAGVLGMKGDVRRGVGRLQGFLKTAQPGDLLYDEAYLCNTYLNLYALGRPDVAWQWANNERGWPAQGNLLRLFVRANIGINSRHADAAIAALRQARQAPGGAVLSVLDYQMGSALLLKLDPAAATYLQRFANTSRSPLFVRDALQKLALAWYLQGNAAKANAALNRISESGNKLTDADKQATRFAQQRDWPHPTLLQARLLTDGGDAAQALSRLHSLGEGALTTPAQRSEYHYRTGRALEETRNLQGALSSYAQAIRIGKNRPEQFAARAALQSGLIYEQLGEAALARSFFQQCLDMPDHDFQASMDQQAKAGLNRLESKK